MRKTKKTSTIKIKNISDLIWEAPRFSFAEVDEMLHDFLFQIELMREEMMLNIYYQVYEDEEGVHGVFLKFKEYYRGTK